MKKICKYPIPLRDLMRGFVPINWTSDSKVIHAEYDDDAEEVVLWVLHNNLSEDVAPSEKRYFSAVGTEWEIEEEFGEHVFTCITSSKYVWHVFARNPSIITVTVTGT